MPAQTKLDLKKELKHLYNPSAKAFSLIEVPPLNYLMVDGAGAPGSPPYVDAVQALYSIAYPLKFMSKRELGIDYTVMPLEGLWWADDLTVFTTNYDDKSTWKWTMMILQPDHITPPMVNAAIAEAAKKKDLSALPSLCFETYSEGLSVQILHIGSYADETPTLHRLHSEYIPQNNLAETGHHHEIYLSDPNKTAPAKLKTILRQPVRRE